MFNPEASVDYLPPNDPWETHNASPDARSYISIYYSEDQISRYPVREVTRPSDNKSDPNLETMSYGLCSTCTRGIRSGLVRNDRPYIFFCTNFKGERHLTGYYHIGWYSKGPPLLTNFSHGSIQDDYRLVADEVRFVYPPISLEEVAEQTGFDDILSGFRKKLVTPEIADELVGLLDSRDDKTGDYIREIRRLERINKRYHGYRYPTWKRSEPFDWETVEQYVRMGSGEADDEIRQKIEHEMAERALDLSSVSYEGVSDWHCLYCDEEFQNNAPLKLCPNCNNPGVIIPAEVA